jgi:hypothetical protein
MFIIKDRRREKDKGVSHVLKLHIYVIAVVGYITLDKKLPIGPIVFVLGFLPIFALVLVKRQIKSAVPDLIFRSIDTGLLAIPALVGGTFFGVAGAITGGVIGDALTAGIDGFFEGSISTC